MDPLIFTNHQSRLTFIYIYRDKYSLNSKFHGQILSTKSFLSNKNSPKHSLNKFTLKLKNTQDKHVIQEYDKDGQSEKTQKINTYVANQKKTQKINTYVVNQKKTQKINTCC